MKLVYAKGNAVVTLPSGVGITVHAGEHWPANDPLVTNHPSLFTDDPTVGLRVSEPLVDDEDGGDDDAEAPVEQATKAPGEKRPTRRRG